MSEYAHSVMMLLSEKAQFILCFFAVITILAWFKAGRDALNWNDSLRRSGAVNLAIAAFNMAALVLPLAATAFLLNLLKDMPHVPGQVWQDAPWLVRAFMALLIFDLANYAMHRLSHFNAWLWPMHAVHHSDTELHFLSANRAHILEWVLLVPTGAIVAGTMSTGTMPTTRISRCSFPLSTSLSGPITCPARPKRSRRDSSEARVTIH